MDPATPPLAAGSSDRADLLLSWDRLGFRLMVFGGLGLLWTLQGRVFGRPWGDLVPGEFLAALPWAFVAPIILAAARRSRGGGWIRLFLGHLVGLVLVFAAYWLVRLLLAGLWAGVTRPWAAFHMADLLPAAPRLVANFLLVPLLYLLILLGIEATEHARGRREEARRRQEQQWQAERLQGQLAQSRLALLQRQIHPHFLFNALQAVSTLLHRDPMAAEEALEKLSILLRTLLDEASGTWELQQEVAITRGYLEIEQIRFGPRLNVVWDLMPDLVGNVPSLILLPLVENAVRHGLSAKRGPGTVRVSVAREGAMLRLQVEDDGPGISGPLEPRIGIGNTRARLEALYGHQAKLDLETPTGGGFRARITLPLEGGHS